MGLKFTRIDDGYSVSIGDCTDTEIIIPDTYQGLPVTSIGNKAFYDSSILSFITIPASVKNIGDYAFYKCKKLTSITIPDSVMSIGKCAFEDCVELASVTIPDSVKSIRAGAFRGCVNLSNKDGFVIIRDVLYDYIGFDSIITIPNKVTCIGIGAFLGHTRVKSIVICNSVTNIEERAFSRCRGFTSITIPVGVDSIGECIFEWSLELTNIYCEAPSKPDGWSEKWNENCKATVHWGAKKSNGGKAKSTGFFARLFSKKK